MRAAPRCQPVGPPMPMTAPSVSAPRPAGGPGFRRLPGWLVLTLLLGLAGAAWPLLDRLLVDRRPIVVGILHSQTGPMAVSERAMIDAEVMALEEINRGGGLLGRPVRWVIADGASDWPTFARQAERLIRAERAVAIFGCLTSASRKAVLPVVEANDHLLVYPMAYEGLEQSPNIVYTGAAPNQQIIPAVQWCHETLGARRFFLVGTDYIWPHCVNEIIKDQLTSLNAELAGEAYIPFAATSCDDVARQIAAARPDVILSSVTGANALPFARAIRAAGLGPAKTPLVTFAIGEHELRDGAAAELAGHYAAWNYFQSLDRPENGRFVRAFRERYGAGRTTSDPLVAAYNGVQLWAQAVREAETTDVAQVRAALRHQSLDAPEGIIAVDPETQHTWRPVFIGRIRPDGQVDVVWSSRTPVRPMPFPISRSRSDWERFVADLARGWGGAWENPGATTRPGGSR